MQVLGFGSALIYVSVIGESIKYISKLYTQKTQKC